MIRNYYNYSLGQFYRIKYKFIRFLFVGALNTLFSLTLYWIMVFFGVHYSLALFIASMLGILFNYKTTGKLVFENDSNKLILRFCAVYLVTYLLNVGGLKLLLLVGVDKYSGAIITTIPLAIVSFVLSKKFVFVKIAEDGNLNNKPNLLQ